MIKNVKLLFKKDSEAKAYFVPGFYTKEGKRMNRGGVFNNSYGHERHMLGIAGLLGNIERAKKSQPSKKKVS